MRKISAAFISPVFNYEIDDIDPAFEKITKADLTDLVKQMVFIDLFQSTNEADILPHIQVTIQD